MGSMIALQSITLADWLFVALSFGPILLLSSAIYNLFFHPLAHVPGPFWARISGIPSWYEALRGKRHIWLWKQFQIYGSPFRPDPNTVLFCDPEAYSDIYGLKSNVRRSRFYEAFKRNDVEQTTLTTIDVTAHARKRKLLTQCFTEKSIRTASAFIITHVNRWNQLMMDENTSITEWSRPVDLSKRFDSLIFDIMGDLCFGKSFDIKEPGENPFSVIPHTIAEYMKFYYPTCRSPMLNLFLWLKPRGVDKLFEFITPPAVHYYNRFVYNNITDRIALYQRQAKLPENERRLDMFHYLIEARDPDTGLPAYSEDELRAESSLFIVAGSDTTAISLSGLFFYLTGHPEKYEKLVKEIRTTFSSVEDIIHGPKLLGCEYLRACIDESIRLTPSGPSELPREVLSGGIRIMGEYYPAGTIVGTSMWVDSRNNDVYGDAEAFRPERWILDASAGVTKETIARMKRGFHPFLSGPGNCIGQNLAITEMSIIVARTLHRLDLRRAPGSTLGGGSSQSGWGERDEKQFQLRDAYVALREGPEVQFRRRSAATS